ncbi:hypothetical protein ASALC70_03639 [Alcanivorax sp. ALC70]|nr:hypothetical protein ASALC70_03639 [Alcanivorax sp. ALC70]
MNTRKFELPVDLPGEPSGETPEITAPDGSPVPDGIDYDPNTGSVTGNLPADYQGPTEVILEVPQRGGGSMEVKVDLNR